MSHDPDHLNAHDRGVTVSKACEILGYSRWTIERMIRRGELEAYGEGKKKRIHLSSILQYQHSSRAGQSSENQAVKEVGKVSKRHRKALSILEELLK